MYDTIRRHLNETLPKCRAPFGTEPELHVVQYSSTSSMHFIPNSNSTEGTQCSAYWYCLCTLIYKAFKAVLVPQKSHRDLLWSNEGCIVYRHVPLRHKKTALFVDEVISLIKSAGKMQCCIAIPKFPKGS
ncbi:uncharacterized [Tachysurus ichikawai]